MDLTKNYENLRKNYTFEDEPNHKINLIGEMTSNSLMSYVKLLVTSRIIKKYPKLSGTSFLHCTVLDGTLEHHMYFLPIFLYQHKGVNLKEQQLLLQINGKNFCSANNYLMINHMTICLMH